MSLKRPVRWAEVSGCWPLKIGCRDCPGTLFLYHPITSAFRYFLSSVLNFSSFPTLARVTRSLLVLFLLTLCLSATAQVPAWQSARAVAVATAAATDNYSYVAATAVDGAGNVYLTGAFRNSVMLGGTTLTSFGSFDVFVAKFNPASNQFVWAQRAGGTGNDLPAALAVSGTSVYVAGYFTSSTAGFGVTNLTNVGPTNTADVFVAKLTEAGNTGSFTWAQRAGGTDNDQAAALAVSGTSVYVAGYFASPAAGFGPANLNNAGPSNTADVFVAEITEAGSTGSFAWAQQAGGTDNDYAAALAVNGTSVYMAGSFQSPTAGFGLTTLVKMGVVANIFVAKLTNAGNTGNFDWAQRAEGTNEDRATALVVSGTSVYVAGSFNSPTAGFGTTNLTNAGNTDVFVAKLTDAGNTGNFVWAQQAGGTGADYVRVLAVSGTNVYVAGSFNSPTAGFGTTNLTNAAPNNTADVFVAKLNDAGSTSGFVWAQRAGGTNNDIANSLALSGSSVYVGGGFTSLTAGFGTIAISNINPSPNSNPYLGFLAALTDATLTATTAPGPREPAALYPNPARRAATLRLPAGTAPAPLVLTDAQGRAVRRYPAPAGPEAVLDLQGLPAGFYLLRGAGSVQHLVVE